MKYDFVIIGGGIGGLICGSLLSKEGYKVCILEKHYTPGGGLHVFKKHGKVFDTGINYVTGFMHGQLLSKLFSYLGLLDNITLKELDSETSDIIHIGEDNHKYKIGSGEENFINGLSKDFPLERENLKRYIRSINELSKKFYLVNLEPRKNEGFSMENELIQPVGKYIDQFTANKKLKRILAWNYTHYAGIYDKTPAFVHILISKFYLEGASRFVDGSQKLADSMVNLIKDAGGEYFTSCEVGHIEVQDKEVKSIKTIDGRTFEAGNYISAIHPATTLDLIDANQIQKSYRNRITSLKNTTSTFTLFITLKNKSFPYLNYNYYYIPTYDSIWKATDYTSETWPKGIMVLTPPTSGDYGYAEKMIVNALMNFDDVKKWENTKTGKRGADYLAFKKKCTNRIMGVLEGIFPTLGDAVEHISASTPLTIRDYTGSKSGAIYGIEKDCNNMIQSIIVPRTKIKNLYLTGQNINLHGLIGVAASALLTAGEFVGTNSLIVRINQDYEQKNETIII
jgi:all-trans-retinol 13,14-reductase